MLYWYIPETNSRPTTMETKALLNNSSSPANRSPILTDMLEQLATQADNPVLGSSPAIKEMQNKEKAKL